MRTVLSPVVLVRRARSPKWSRAPRLTRLFLALVAFASPVHAGVPFCVGDCGADGRVTVVELIIGVNIALGASPVSRCSAMDANGDQRVSVDELVQAVNALLHGCPAPPSATPTIATQSPTATGTLSPTLTLHTRTPTAPIDLPTSTATVDLPTPTPTSTSTATGTPSLLAMLKQGGFVIHWRHSAADVCADCTAAGPAENPVVPDWWRSCEATCPANISECTTAGLATARQLNANGVVEATSMRDVFDQQAIPVGRVLSSEFCRCFRTAELLDFGPQIEQRTDITFFVYDDLTRCANSYALLAEVPASGTNTAIIGHTGFGTPCPVLQELQWSEAAIFKPDGQGGTVLVDRVLWNEWEALE